MKDKLHPLQQSLLKLLAKNIDDPLTIRQMQEEINASSTSIVAHHLAQLEKKGYLKKNPYNPKDYQVLHAPERGITYLNLYGLAHCGPKGSVLDGDPADRIAISTKLLTFPADLAFMVKAKGDSMEPKIQDGDFVIAKKSNEAHDGEIVVCVNDGEALVKKIKKSGKDYILISLNHEYQPFIALSKNFHIEGIVKGVISNKFFA
jgi:repressor LexA